MCARPRPSQMSVLSFRKKAQPFEPAFEKRAGTPTLGAKFLDALKDQVLISSVGETMLRSFYTFSPWEKGLTLGK
jgi:hypothetical protein